MIKIVFLISLLLSFSANAINVEHTDVAPNIDGVNDEPQWQKAKWLPINSIILGAELSASDFSGEYRLLWDKNHLYLQARIIDDVLIDSHANPTDSYWDDDCIEIFIDEDGSGGDHQYNYNAFAYHVALDNQVVDIGPSKQPALYNHHIKSRWQRSAEAPNEIIWELAISLFDDSYSDKGTNLPVELTAEKLIGFMLAYCDNDGSAVREHFIGSKEIKPVNGDKNRGWIDASVFDSIVLKK